MTVWQDTRSSSGVVRFGVFEADLRAGELRKNGLKIRLPGQPFEVLAMMLERRGGVVTREELQKRLWPDGTFVDFDHSLNNAINKIREALGDSAESPRFVETLARRGYRFIAPVEGISKGSALSQPQPPSPWARLPHLKWLLPIFAFPRRSWVWLGTVFVMLVMAVGLWLYRGSTEKPQTVPEVIPLTTYPGFERSPSFSPDGNQVAFSWNGEKQDNYDIYVKLIGSEKPLRLTTDPAEDVSPAFSPDGRSIGFVRVTKDAATFIVIPSIGGPERSVAKIPPPHIFFTDGPLFAWFPDSKWVVINGLALLSIESGEMRNLTSPPSKIFTDASPAVSLDGLIISFGRWLGWGRSGINLLFLTENRTPKGEPQQVTFLRTLRTPASIWTPSDQEIIFTSRRSLWRIAASGGGEPEQLPFGRGEASWPAISRSGKRLAYERKLFDSNIWRLPLSTPGTATSPPARFIASTLLDSTPQYSPDGKRIAFNSERTGPYLSTWVSDADGSNAAELVSRSGKVSGSPSWSPDGQRIAFDSDLEGNMNIYVVGSSGGKPVRLTTDPAEHNVPRWSRDGNWIYFASARSSQYEVWKALAEGGEAVQVTRNGGFAALESLDGKTLYYTKGIPEVSMALWKVPVNGGEESQVLPSVRWRAFDLVDTGIYFIPDHPDSDGKRAIQFLSFDTGKVKTVSPIPSPTFHGLTVSPDRRHLLYTQIDDDSSDLMLVENFR